MTRARLLSLVAPLVFLSGCMSLDYDLRDVTVPISAQPAAAGEDVDGLTIQATHVLYVHGLLGEREPDVAWMINNSVVGYDHIADFRISHSATFHDWLLTHLSLTLLRFKTVTIEMDRVR